MDALELEIMWTSLMSVVNERAKAMQRAAFSAVVREAGDLAFGMFDTRGRMIVQAETGTPGHINCLEVCGRLLVEQFGDTIQPGDVLATNDPWMGAGHYFDVTVFGPIFRNRRVIGYLGSTNHHVDVGGLGMGYAARDVHQEGLCIPPVKLVCAGVPNDDVYRFVRGNVRQPDMVVGDLAAQTASIASGGIAVNELCDRFGIEDLEQLSDEIIARSEKATRDAIRQCPAGTSSDEFTFEVGNHGKMNLKVQLTIDKDAGEVLLDFTGSSDQVDFGVNVVENYARAYATFTILSSLARDIPHNSGTLLPVKFFAPPGCIVNCQYPAAVAGRHIVGMFVPMPILNALHKLVPEKVLANSCGCPSGARMSGIDADGKRFQAGVSIAGGMGARFAENGLHATNFPTGISATPVEMIESESPVVIHKKVRRGSGGAGRTRGGDGLVIEFGMRTGKPWLISPGAGAKSAEPRGLAGGSPGQAGDFYINGESVVPQQQQRLEPNDVVRIETPGGGGFGVV